MSEKKKAEPKKEAPKKEAPKKETPKKEAPKKEAESRVPVFILKWIPRSPYLGGRIHYLTPSQKKWAEKKGIARDPTKEELSSG